MPFPRAESVFSANICVVAASIPSAIEWLVNEHHVDWVRMRDRFAGNTQTGVRYIIVTEDCRDSILGWTFDKVLVAPCYRDLPTHAKSRIRISKCGIPHIVEDQKDLIGE